MRLPVQRGSVVPLWVPGDYPRGAIDGPPGDPLVSYFTTGCGSTTGGLIPVIKAIANPQRAQLIANHADFDATPVIRGEKTIREMGAELYRLTLAVAAGRLTKSEVYGHYEA